MARSVKRVVSRAVKKVAPAVSEKPVAAVEAADDGPTAEDDVRRQAQREVALRRFQGTPV